MYDSFLLLIHNFIFISNHISKIIFMSIIHKTFLYYYYSVLICVIIDVCTLHKSYIDYMLFVLLLFVIIFYYYLLILKYHRFTIFNLLIHMTRYVTESPISPSCM